MSAQFFKSPMNYTGNKYKLLTQIIPFFHQEIETFVDAFCGGLDVSLNVSATKKICNDKISQLIDLYKNLQVISGEESNKFILALIDKYNLSKINANEFIAFMEREEESKCKDKELEYGYDSLCLRYKLAREQQARYEAGNIYKDFEQSMKIAKRDELKFFEILGDLLNINKGDK